jgi:hypothetical protein
MIVKNLAVTGIVLLCCFAIGFPSEKYQCGEKRIVNRHYGKVELRVNCTLDTTAMWVAEYRGDKLHGISVAYDRATGMHSDSSFFQNGKEQGTSLGWDGTGFVTNKVTYRNGLPIGREERYFGPGKPAAILNYNSKGRKHGQQQEWWPNGSKKFEVTYKNGEVLSGMEYYQNGRPRIRYVMPSQPKRNWFSQLTISYESWAPDGRSAGVVKNGQGEIVRFRDTVTNIHSEGFHEIYRDSLQANVEDWDAATVAKWLENYRKPHPDSTAPIPPKGK